MSRKPMQGGGSPARKSICRRQSRAVDSRCDTVDFHPSQTSHANAVRRFLGKALRGCRDWQEPCVISTGKAGRYGQAIREMKKEGKRPSQQTRQVNCLKSVVEADHGKIERLISPTLGFKSMKAA